MSNSAPTRAIRLTTPAMRRLAGHRFFPLWAVLRHVGRKSGTTYEIPVAVLVTPTTFVIGMPWGRRTNWVQNVLAAGGCTIRWKGHEFACTQPELVDRSVALAACSRWEQTVISRARIEEFLQLRRRRT